MPRTSIRIGEISRVRVRRRRENEMDERLGEMIRAHAAQAWAFPAPGRARLIEFGSEGERGPPQRDEMV